MYASVSGGLLVVTVGGFSGVLMCQFPYRLETVQPVGRIYSAPLARGCSVLKLVLLPYAHTKFEYLYLAKDVLSLGLLAGDTAKYSCPQPLLVGGEGLHHIIGHPLTPTYRIVL